MNESQLSQWVDNQLTIREKEKNTFGEVFTSSKVIKEMLDVFPKSIWKNPEFTWLDPCVGTGGFMAFIYLRLMDGLRQWESNEEKRSNHIRTKMLFMVEINPSNCRKCRQLFGRGNVVCGDYLKQKATTSFDCIVTNPPFHDDYGLDDKGRRIKGGKNKIYERILLKCMSEWNANGYLCFVVPDNLFGGNGSLVYQQILNKRRTGSSLSRPIICQCATTSVLFFDAKSKKRN